MARRQQRSQARSELLQGLAPNSVFWFSRGCASWTMATMASRSRLPQRCAPRRMRPAATPCRAARLRALQRVGPAAARQRLGEAPLQQRAQASGVSLRSSRWRGQRRRQRCAGNAAAPEVVHHVAGAGRCRRPAASSCIGMPVLNGASASARWQKPWIVKIEASSKLCSARSRRAACPRRPGRARRAGCCSSASTKVSGARRPAAAQPRQRFGDARADALAQFGGGGVGEGDDQDVLPPAARAPAAAADTGRTGSRSCRCRPRPRSAACRRAGRRRRRRRWASWRAQPSSSRHGAAGRTRARGQRLRTRASSGSSMPRSASW